MMVMIEERASLKLFTASKMIAILPTKNPMKALIPTNMIFPQIPMIDVLMMTLSRFILLFSSLLKIIKRMRRYKKENAYVFTKKTLYNIIYFKFVSLNMR